MTSYGVRSTGSKGDVVTGEGPGADPAGMMALLWRDAAAVPRRGPTRRLDVGAVVTAAISLADADGLDAVTMRAVARAATTAPMTLYTYVPGRAELLDLMLDQVLLQMSRTDTGGQPWRARATAVAQDNLALHDTHPWTLQIAPLRPVLGPGSIGKYEQELGAFDGLGLTDVLMDDCLTYLLSFVRSAAQLRVESIRNRQDSGMDDAQWWARHGPQLARVFDPRRYPLAGRVGSTAGAAHQSALDPDHAYRFGLRRTLAGLAELIGSD